MPLPSEARRKRLPSARLERNCFSSPHLLPSRPRFIARGPSPTRDTLSAASGPGRTDCAPAVPPRPAAAETGRPVRRVAGRSAMAAELAAPVAQRYPLYLLAAGLD